MTFDRAFLGLGLGIALMIVVFVALFIILLPITVTATWAHYTVINEPYVTALFSAYWGWWNEAASSARCPARCAGRAHPPDLIAFGHPHHIRPPAAPRARVSDIRIISLQPEFYHGWPTLIRSTRSRRAATAASSRSARAPRRRRGWSS